MPPFSRGISRAALRTFRFRTPLSSLPHARHVQQFIPLPPRPVKTKSPHPVDKQQEEGGQQEPGSASGPEERNWWDHWQRFTSPVARRWLWRLFYIAPLLLFIKTEFPLELMWVNGASMTPFLNTGVSPDLPQPSDAILVQKALFPDRFHGIRLPKWELKRGQIVVFSAPHNPDKIAVKRVVAVPGDRVEPLPGYPGGDAPVVVPYNHIWVEGDANSRGKSVDSNWYGPISQNLVVGLVKVVFTAWNSPVVVRWDEHDYPAKHSGRVEEDVVHDAQIDPDTKSLSDAFADGTAARELAAIQKNRERLPSIMRDRKKFLKMVSMYDQARRELEQPDPTSEPVARALIQELEVAFEAVGLARDGRQLLPALQYTAEDNVTARTDQARKRARLRDYLERRKGTETEAAEERT